MNKFLFGSFLLVLLLSIVGFATAIVPFLADNAELLLEGAEKIGLILMLINGTFYRSKLFKVAKFFIGLLIVGAIFKILHLEAADQIMFCAFTGMIVVYVVHFLKKKGKKILDYLKLITVILLVMPRELYLFRIISEDVYVVVDLIRFSVLVVTFVVFVVSEWERLLDRQKV